MKKKFILLCKIFAKFLQILNLHTDFRPREESVNDIFYLQILAQCVNTKETWIAFEVEHSLHGSVLSSIGLSESSCRIGLVSQYVLVKEKRLEFFFCPFF